LKEGFGECLASAFSVPDIYWTSFIFASPANEKQNFSKCYKTRYPKEDEKGYVFPKPILRK